MVGITRSKVIFLGGGRHIFNFLTLNHSHLCQEGLGSSNVFNISRHINFWLLINDLEIPCVVDLTNSNKTGTDAQPNRLRIGLARDVQLEDTGFVMGGRSKAMHQPPPKNPKDWAGPILGLNWLGSWQVVLMTWCHHHRVYSILFRHEHHEHQLTGVVISCWMTYNR